jgi:phage baseplate assembly protein V
MMRAMQKMLEPVRRGLATLVNRAVLQAVNDAGGLQEVQVQALADEVLDRIERFQQYGLTTVPLPGAEGLLLSVGGSRSNAVIIAVDDRRFRLLGLKGGEVALYTDEGDFIHFKRGNVIAVKTLTLEVDAAQSNFSGDITATGDVTAGSVSLRGHVHPENDEGGPTGAPVGG